MAKFFGGPYDGMDLPFDPLELRRVNLPETHELEAFLHVRGSTSLFSWPYVYEADNSVTPPGYRFIEPRKPAPPSASAQ